MYGSQTPVSAAPVRGEPKRDRERGDSHAAKLEAGRRKRALADAEKRVADLDAERDVLKPLFEKGGRFLIMLDPVTLNGKSLPNLESLLKLYNVEVKPGLIVEGDAGRIMSSSPVYLVPNIEPHAITDPLTASGTPIIVPMAGALQLPQEPPESTMTITPLLQTSEKAYLKTGDLQSASASQEPGDESGPFVIAAALEKTNSSNDDDTARAVIIYNTAFATSTQYTNYTNNMDLVLNAANWMRNTSQDDIYIRAKALTNPVLIMQSQAQLISVLAVSVLLIPVVMLVVGIAVYLKRKHL